MGDRRKRFYRSHIDSLNIPAKANRILNVVLVGMLLIVFRIWHLGVVQYDEKLEESRKPQRRIVMEAAKRATIRDRFNIPLAINKMQYQVAIHYSQIKQIPSIAWETDASGKRVKHFKRKEYITALSQLLADELEIEADRVEDLIHAKAAFFNQIPFTLKEDINERQYYRLKMLEKDWPGIGVHYVPRRNYPLAKVGGDILGYMGAISNHEYEEIIREMRALECYIENIDAGEVIPPPQGIQTTDEARRRLKDLQELSYSVNDSIGKSGIEGRFEKTLRGFRGKKSYYSDARGNFLRELPGTREPLSGKRLLLTISSELQAYAEQLLVQNEQIRETRLSHIGPVKKTILAQKTPWIKGGAIVAMDPNNGEVLALASLPRLDPNDFIRSGNSEDNKIKNFNLQKWLESDSYIAEIWDQQRPLDREAFADAAGIYSDELELNWTNYLDCILGKESALRKTILTHGTIEDAVRVQTAASHLQAIAPKADAYTLFDLLYLREGYRTHGKSLGTLKTDEIQTLLTNHFEEVQWQKRQLEPYLGSIMGSYDQVLLIDLLRVAVPAERFSDELLQAVGKQSLARYKEVSVAMLKMHDTVKLMAKELFHAIDFKEWRKANEKEFLKQKREEEKLSRRFAKPYLDYLDSMECEMFQQFWQQHRWQLMGALLDKTEGMEQDISAHTYLQPYYEHLLAWQREIKQGAHREIDWAPAYRTLSEALKPLPQQLCVEYLQTMRSFHNLDRPLLGNYRSLRKNVDQKQQEKHLAAAFYPKFGYGYGRSQAYRQAATQGSIFKLITSYEGMVQRYQDQAAAGKSTDDLNPLEMIDTVYHKGKDMFVGTSIAGQPIPRYYKGGRLPRSANPNNGRLDVLKALEVSSNPYFSLIAGDILKSPQDLVNAAKKFSFGKKTGIDLPGEIAGSLPDDLDYNRTGLYSMAIGQHTLVVTPLQTTVMLAALANGGKVFKPKIVEMMVGKDPQRGRELVSDNSYFPYQERLRLVDIDFPLFIAADAEQQKSLIKPVPTEVQRTIFLPDAIRRILLDGMCRVVAKTHSESLNSLTRLYRQYPQAIAEYKEFKEQLLGKTSTAESMENIDLDLDEGTNIYTHVWFGGVVYEENVLDKNKHSFLFRNSFGHPELVVVVYLRYGGYGKEASPIAAQMAKRWREIKQSHKAN